MKKHCRMGSFHCLQRRLYQNGISSTTFDLIGQSTRQNVRNVATQLCRHTCCVRQRNVKANINGCHFFAGLLKKFYFSFPTIFFEILCLVPRRGNFFYQRRLLFGLGSLRSPFLRQIFKSAICLWQKPDHPPDAQKKFSSRLRTKFVIAVRNLYLDVNLDVNEYQVA